MVHTASQTTTPPNIPIDKYVIGFTETFYTLWHVYEPQRTWVNQWEYYDHQDAWYIQNLSTDLERAKKKAEAITGRAAEVDLSLRGKYRNTIWQSEKQSIMEPHQCPFRFGDRNLLGKDMREFGFSDAYPLRVVYSKIEDPKYKAQAEVALARLLELGELELWEDGKAYRPHVIAKMKRDQVVAAGNGWHFENGEKVELEVKLIEAFSFEVPSFSGYGTSRVFIERYFDRDGRVMLYKGGNPPGIGKEDGWVRINAKAKLAEYNGEKQTQLQYIKFL